jgi:hypothetical protein
MAEDEDEDDGDWLLLLLFFSVTTTTTTTTTSTTVTVGHTLAPSQFHTPSTVRSIKFNFLRDRASYENI